MKFCMFYSKPRDLDTFYSKVICKMNYLQRIYDRIFKKMEWEPDLKHKHVNELLLMQEDLNHLQVTLENHPHTYIFPQGYDLLKQAQMFEEDVLQTLREIHEFQVQMGELTDEYYNNDGVRQ